MLIALASDHAGFEYKERLKLFLIEAGHVIEDFGVDSTEPADYPLCIRPCALAVAAGEVDRGIIFGGSGNGEAIVANRVPGIRCATWGNAKHGFKEERMSSELQGSNGKHGGEEPSARGVDTALLDHEIGLAGGEWIEPDAQ